ncbi:tabersonine 16-hydroxylase 1-like [Cryptomeria japonica]|uniref:tabersonine 16-hydroxylase 1-like n=1 Tax=Cryptomeria japonica TaxID=3369 RepID=UPI0027D9DF92|nr:tabersonine 16-hydroxylase 1-like [Cryptomeria japonica]
MGELIHSSFYDISKKYGPIASLKMGFVTIIVISSPEMAKEILKTNYLFYDFKDVGFTPYRPYWRQMKKLFMVELLNAKRIESMRSMREEAVSLAVRSVWEKSRHGTVAVNLSQIIASLATQVSPTSKRHRLKRNTPVVKPHVKTIPTATPKVYVRRSQRKTWKAHPAGDPIEVISVEASKEGSPIDVETQKEDGVDRLSNLLYVEEHLEELVEEIPRPKDINIVVDKENTEVKVVDGENIKISKTLANITDSQNIETPEMVVFEEKLENLEKEKERIRLKVRELKRKLGPRLDSLIIQQVELTKATIPGER